MRDYLNYVLNFTGSLWCLFFLSTEAVVDESMNPQQLTTMLKQDEEGFKLPIIPAKGFDVRRCIFTKLSMHFILYYYDFSFEFIVRAIYIFR